MKKINLLKSYPTSAVERIVKSNTRTIDHRIISTYRDINFFDGNRNYGYGGFKYDTRWIPVIKDIFNYANLKEKINKFEDAIKLYLKALKFKKEVKKDYIFLKLSDLYLSIGNFDKAKHFAQKIVKKNPDNIAGHVQLSKFINYIDI